MKTIALTAVIALGVAAPVFAQSQLEQSVGAAPGQYTLSQLVELKDRATGSGNEARSFFEPNETNFSTSNRSNPVADRIFQQLADESRGDKS